MLLGLASLTLSMTAAAAAVPISNSNSTQYQYQYQYGACATESRAFAFPKSSQGFVFSDSKSSLKGFGFRISNSCFKTAVASVDSNQLNSSSNPPDKLQTNNYYFVVANAKLMLDEEEHFQELLFERLRNYGERNKEQDFWLVIEPKFLDKLPNITKRLRRPVVALVSTNGPWIT